MQRESEGGMSSLAIANTTISEQYERWLDFSQRMALSAWPAMTKERAQRLHTEVTAFIQLYADQEVSDWDSDPYPCDAFREYFEEYDERQWGGDWPIHSFINQACCCVRAGLDLAYSPSAGVFGFTVGSLRRMYVSNIPAWIIAFYKEDGDLSTLPDDEEIWL